MLQAGNPNFEDLRQEYEKIKAYWWLNQTL